MQATFEPVAPEQLRRAWAFVRPALDSMERCGRLVTQDVFMTLRSNGATLYMICDETGQQAGFHSPVVTRV